MDYLPLLVGQGEPLPIYRYIAACLADIRVFPDEVEIIYREAMTLPEESLDRVRFALLRLQIYADVHRNEDLEQAQSVRYVAQVLEKIIFGNLLLEFEEPIAD
jgi:hypothetical protein